MSLVEVMPAATTSCRTATREQRDGAVRYGTVRRRRKLFFIYDKPRRTDALRRKRPPSAMIPQGDLFAPALLQGLAFVPDVIGPEEEAALIALFERIELAPFRFQGWTGKRMTAS